MRKCPPPPHFFISKWSFVRCFATLKRYNIILNNPEQMKETRVFFWNQNVYIYPWFSLQWRHNGHDSVSNHQHHDCLLNRSFRCRSKRTSKLTGHCAGNSPGTGEFPAQMASNAENVSIWRRHHVKQSSFLLVEVAADLHSLTHWALEDLC